MSGHSASRFLGLLTGTVIALGLGGPPPALAAMSSPSSSPDASASPTPTPVPATDPPLAATVAPSASATPVPNGTPQPTGYTHILGLGDSVPAGSGCFCSNYVTLFGQRLATAETSRFTVLNLARGGAVSLDILQQVRSSSIGIPTGRVSIITVGANDFDEAIVGTPQCRNALCYLTTLRSVDGSIRAILSSLLHNQAGASTGTSAIVLTNYWNIFRDGAAGRSRGPVYVANNDALTRRVNALLRYDASVYRVTYADLYSPFKGTDGRRDDTSFLAADGYHPNAEGHRVIAAVLQRALAHLA